jgi:hypothetical protein
MSNYTCDRVKELSIYPYFNVYAHHLKLALNQSFIYSLFIRIEIIHGKNVPEG